MEIPLADNDCLVFFQGSFARNEFTFQVYFPATKQVEDSRIEDWGNPASQLLATFMAIVTNVTVNKINIDCTEAKVHQLYFKAQTITTNVYCNS